MSEINMEQSLASVVRYVQDNSPEGTMMYFDEIPEAYYVPSVYFPVPITESKKVTFESYLVTVTVEPWFMAHKDWDANAAAVAMRECIIRDGLRIPYVDQDGEDIKRHMHVTEPILGRVDEGIYKLSFKVQDYFEYKDENEETTSGFVLDLRKPAEEQDEEPE